MGDVVDNDTLAINRSDTFSFGGVISGSGAFTQMGTGSTISPPPTPILAARRSALHTAAWQRRYKRLIVGDVVDSGTLAINRSDTFSLGGVISGSGAFAQVGKGTTILTATNTYTGGTTIRAGTLQLGNGGASGSIVGDVANSGTLAINRSDTFSFGGVISGEGAFQQLGTGTTVLAGKNTYTGPTTVKAGTLLVDGSLEVDGSLDLASAVTVESGATLGGGPAIAEAGRGIIGGDLTNGGIVSPGHSPGTHCRP